MAQGSAISVVGASDMLVTENGAHVTALSHDFGIEAASVAVMDTLTSLLTGRRSADPCRRSWPDYVLLIVVILLALVALRYMHGVGGPTTWIE